MKQDILIYERVKVSEEEMLRAATLNISGEDGKTNSTSEYNLERTENIQILKDYREVIGLYLNIKNPPNSESFNLQAKNVFLIFIEPHPEDNMIISSIKSKSEARIIIKNEGPVKLVLVIFKDKIRTKQSNYFKISNSYPYIFTFEKNKIYIIENFMIGIKVEKPQEVTIADCIKLESDNRESDSNLIQSATSDKGHIYIISEPQNLLINKYKIGKHKDKKSVILSRYRTYFTHPQIFLFEECKQYSNAEREILHILRNIRVMNSNNRLSEFVIAPLESFTEIIKIIINKYNIIDDKNEILKLNEYNQIIDKYLQENPFIEKLVEKKSTLKIIKKSPSHISSLNIENLISEKCILYDKKSKQFERAKMETEYSYLAMLAYDQHFSKFSFIPKPELLKYIAIGKICQILKVINTMDRQTPINSKTIHENLEWFANMHKGINIEISYKQLFSLRSEPITDFKGALTMINSIFTSWSCTKLINQKRDRTKGEVSYIYLICEAKEGFDDLFYLLQSKRVYGFQDMVDERKSKNNAFNETKTSRDFLSEHISNKKNEIINMNSFNNCDIQLLDNDIRKYHRYTEVMQLQDYINNNMVYLQNGTYHFNNFGLQAKQIENKRIQDLINEGKLFEYNNPSDPLHSGIYYTSDTYDYRSVSGVSGLGLKLVS